MRMQRNYYEVLGVQKNSSQAEIKAKYLNLARQYHPDRAKDKEVADRLFVQINRAYTTLRNPTKRAQYDATLIAAEQTSMRPPSSQQGYSPVQSQQTYVAPQAQHVTSDVVRSWLEQASRLQIQGNGVQALDLCNKVIAADPSNLQAVILAGDLLAQASREAEAISMYERALAIQPGNRILREKISRTTAARVRRTGQAAAQPRPVPPTGQSKPPQTGPNTAQTPSGSRPSTEAAPDTSKSFLDKLIGRK
jgi:DnaJ-domain-containing protein 1